MFYNFVRFHSTNRQKKTKYSFIRKDCTTSKSTIAIIAYELIYFTETNVSSDENTYNSINDCLNRLKTLKFDGLPLTIDENGKRKWNGSYEGLKDFVDKTLGLKGSWSSPGGYLKLFCEASESIVIRHYTNTASFLVQGQKGELFTNILMHKLSNISSNVSAQTLMQSVTNDSVLDLCGFTLEPQGTPIHVGNVAAINRDLT